MLRKLIALLPPGFVRAVGRLQHRFPFLRRFIRSTASQLAASEGTIAHGVGKGLKFNATGGYLGYLLGTSEKEEQEAFAQALKEGGVFYDLGANIGFYATLAGRTVGPEGRVYAFEPFPESAERTRYNAQLNNFQNVEIFEVAVSDRAGIIHLVSGEFSAQHLISDSVHGKSKDIGQPDMERPCVALDDFIAENNLRPPTVIMIDIEGAELRALEGMAKTLQQYRPIILLEVHWIMKELNELYETLLKPMGYTMRMMDGGPFPTENTRYHVVLEAK